MKITIIGSGSWGGALAQVLAINGNDVLIWSKYKEEVDSININRKILKLDNSNIEHRILKNISASMDMEYCLKNVEVVVFAIPSQFLRETAEFVQENLKYPCDFITATKGIEYGTNYTMTEVIESTIKKRNIKSLACISGPSHAEEVINQKLTSVVIASNTLKEGKKFKELFNNKNFKIFLNTDIIGVQIGGALKNIIAILSGIVSVQNLGDNAHAAIITRGLSEIVKIGEFLGAKSKTFLGLSGVGDLIVTSTSSQSRNFQAGKLLAKGKNFEEISKDLNYQTIEGLFCIKSAYNICLKNNIKAPMIEILNNILNGNNSIVSNLSYKLLETSCDKEFE